MHNHSIDTRAEELLPKMRYRMKANHRPLLLNKDRAATKRRFCEFSRTASVLDMRPDEERERAKILRQAERYEARHGTAGKRSVFE